MRGRSTKYKGMRQRGFLKEAPLDSPRTFNAFFRGANMVRRTKRGMPISPLVRVFEILKNFFQEVFKQGLGQRPKVLEVLYARIDF